MKHTLKTIHHIGNNIGSPGFRYFHNGQACQLFLLVAVKGIVSYYGHAGAAGAALTGAGMFFTFSNF